MKREKKIKKRDRSKRVESCGEPFLRQAPTALYKYSVEYQAQRIFDGGRVMEKHARTASIIKGKLTVAQEQDNLRHRTVLVARLQTGSARQQIPPLFDVTLVASTAETWTIAGFERLEAGPMGHVHLVGQAWLIEPVTIQDLIDVERKWKFLSMVGDNNRRVTFLREATRHEHPVVGHSTSRVEPAVLQGNRAQLAQLVAAHQARACHRAHGVARAQPHEHMSVLKHLKSLASDWAVLATAGDARFYAAPKTALNRHRPRRLRRSMQLTQATSRKSVRRHIPVMGSCWLATSPHSGG